jgi:hypothetical protein
MLFNYTLKCQKIKKYKVQNILSIYYTNKKIITFFLYIIYTLKTT